MLDEVVRQLRQSSDVEVRLSVVCRRCGWTNRVTLPAQRPDDAEVRRWTHCPKCYEVTQRERAFRKHRR